MAKWNEARSIIPNLSEEVYAVAEYLSANIPNLEDIDPDGLAMNLILARIDIEKGVSGYHDAVLPEAVLRNRALTLQQLPYILQLVDAIYPQNYAKVVRQRCKESLGWDVPKFIAVTHDFSDEPPYVKAAVSWWADVLQHPRQDNGEESLSIFLDMLGGPHAPQFTPEMVAVFRSRLAANIESEIAEYGEAYLEVDYNPCLALAEAGEAIGLGPFDFPFKTRMLVSPTKVSVSYGYGATAQIIWQAE